MMKYLYFLLFLTYSLYIVPLNALLLFKGNILSNKVTGLRPRLHPLKFSSVNEVTIQLYDLQLRVSNIFDVGLTKLTLTSGLVLLLGGALTALSPCALGLLPITLSYLQSSSSNDASNSYLTKIALYTLGIVTAFTILGGAAGFIGSVIPLPATVKDLFLGLAYIILGLNLLELFQFNFPTSQLTIQRSGAFLYGLTSALIGSACTTPILAALLTYISSLASSITGLSVLGLFSLGYIAPVLTAVAIARANAAEPMKLTSSHADTHTPKLPPVGVIANKTMALLLLGYGSFTLTNTLTHVI